MSRTLLVRVKQRKRKDNGTILLLCFAIGLLSSCSLKKDKRFPAIDRELDSYSLFCLLYPGMSRVEAEALIGKPLFERRDAAYYIQSRLETHESPIAAGDIFVRYSNSKVVELKYFGKGCGFWAEKQKEADTALSPSEQQPQEIKWRRSSGSPDKWTE